MAARQLARRLKLHVKNLPWTASRNDLSEYFSKYGAVTDSVVVFNKKTGMSRGYGFVGFKEFQSMNAALSQKTHFLEGSEISVFPAHISQDPIREIEQSTDSDQNGQTLSDNEPVDVKSVLKE